jgi:hypothetical protein
MYYSLSCKNSSKLINYLQEEFTSLQSDISFNLLLKLELNMNQ